MPITEGSISVAPVSRTLICIDKAYLLYPKISTWGEPVNPFKFESLSIEKQWQVQIRKKKTFLQRIIKGIMITE